MRSGSPVKCYRFNILRPNHAYRRDDISIARNPQQDKFGDEIVSPCTGAAKPRLVQGFAMTVNLLTVISPLNYFRAPLLYANVRPVFLDPAESCPDPDTPICK